MDKVAQIWRELYEKGNNERICELLELDPNQAKVIQYGTSLLHIAAGSGFFEEVLLLLNAGADVGLVTETDGNTPLHNAAAGSHAQTCRILLNRGASTTITNRYGQKPIDCAKKGDIWAWEKGLSGDRKIA